jgi:hypothetical protein
MAFASDECVGAFDSGQTGLESKSPAGRDSGSPIALIPTQDWNSLRELVHAIPKRVQRLGSWNYMRSTIIIAGATKTIIHVVIKLPSKGLFCSPYVAELKACLIHLSSTGAVQTGSWRSPALHPRWPTWAQATVEPERAESCHIAVGRSRMQSWHGNLLTCQRLFLSTARQYTGRAPTLDGARTAPFKLFQFILHLCEPLGWNRRQINNNC